MPAFVLTGATPCWLQGQEVDAMHRSQAMAEAGDVDGSMVCAQQAETYKKQHETLHTSLTAPERVMTVCEVCGVFINSTDNDQRRQVRKPMSEVSAKQRHLKPLSHFIACCYWVSVCVADFPSWVLFTLLDVFVMRISSPVGGPTVMGVCTGHYSVCFGSKCWQAQYWSSSTLDVLCLVKSNPLN